MTTETHTEPLDLDGIRARYERYEKVWPCADEDRFWALAAALAVANDVPTLLAEVERLRALMAAADVDPRRVTVRPMRAIVNGVEWACEAKFTAGSVEDAPCLVREMREAAERRMAEGGWPQ